MRHLLPPSSTLTRRAASSALCAVLLPLLARIDDNAAFAAVILGSGAESVQRAASLRPGYGPPDALYPAAFRGRWTVRSSIVEVRCPQGEASAPAEQLQAARLAAAAREPLVFDVRFLDVDGGGGLILQNEGGTGVALATRPLAGRVIADRGFNAERRANAQQSAQRSPDSFSAKWDASFPNVLVLTSEASGSVTEAKIIKRLLEEPYDGAF